MRPAAWARPGRREVGHGKLAWRAIHPLLPEKEKFPYTLRVVSEITESNGSSSMATVCGSSLALMDAGVPLKRPVAGIAMGLIKEDRGFAVLSDILGDEDHLGDMDFKVAGTESGITALQMDIKITSITPEIMRIALEQARDGRMHILGEMAKALTGARGDVAATAPRITIMNVPKEKIREVIGTGGKVIREIVEQTGCKIDIEDDGTIKIAATDVAQAQRAIDWIRGIVAEPEIGIIYNGKVVKTADFGAFVNFLGSRDGLVHISELQQGRVGKTTDVVNVGDQVKVKVIGFDDRGKVKLSMRVVDQATGEDITEKVGAKPGRGDRDRDRGDRGERRERQDADAPAEGCRAAGGRRVTALPPPATPHADGRKRLHRSAVSNCVTVVSHGLWEAKAYEGDQRDPHGRHGGAAARRGRQGHLHLQRHLVRHTGRSPAVSARSARSTPTASTTTASAFRRSIAAAPGASGMRSWSPTPSRAR